MKRVKVKHKSTDKNTPVELKVRLNKLMLNVKNHPDKLFDKLIEINIAYEYWL